jgi:hypothetical protein
VRGQQVETCTGNAWLIVAHALEKIQNCEVHWIAILRDHHTVAALNIEL